MISVIYSSEGIRVDVGVVSNYNQKSTTQPENKKTR